MDSCWFTIDSATTNITLINSTLTYYNYTNSSIPDGDYTVQFYCNDTNSNVNNSESVNFTIDTPPTVTLISPTTLTTDTDGTVSFTYNPTDSGTIENCSLIYNDGIYTSTSSVTKDANNVILVSDIISGHPLFKEVLLWSVNCTDNFGNTSSSETRELRTQPESGTGYAGGTGSTAVIKNPRTINIFYTKEWKQGKTQTIEIESYNTEGDLFEPENIKFNYSILGVTLKDSQFIINKSVNVFEINRLTELGEYEMSIIISDQRKLRKNITIEIIESEESLSSKVEAIAKRNKLMFWIGVTIVVLLVFIVLVIAFRMDNERKKKKKCELPLPKGRGFSKSS